MNQPHGRRLLPNLLIRASAGTGKTFRLSNRFIELLRGDVASDHILATTFTRKAAGEILDRVIQRLAEATQNEGKRSELGQYTGGKSVSRDECLRLLQTAMRHLHRLRVSTLDSFFSQVARSFAFEIGLPPGWQIVHEVDDARLRSQAINAVLTQDDPSRLRTLLNLLAKGQASRSVAQLIHDTVDALYDLFLETKAEAWTKVPRSKPLDEVQLAEALEDLRSIELPDASLSKAREADYDRAVEGDWQGFLAKGLAKKVHVGDPVYRRKPIPGEAVAVYERLVDHVKGELVGRVAMQTEATYQLLEKFDVEYQRLKYSHRAMRFEDVTRRVGDIRSLVDGGRLSFRLDSRIDHLLLDEFQDTSPRQWRVLRPLAERVSSEIGGRSFFCVGDVKQAIYGWRGGVAEIFDAIDQQLDDLNPESLDISFRCSQPVVDAVNRVFGGISKHSNLGRAESAVGRWCDRFKHHETAKKELAGYVELLTGPRPAEGQSQRDATIEFAARRIAEIVAGAPGFSVGVLVRKNETVGRLIYELREQDIQASEEGGNPLTDSAAVMVVLSLLRLADHPGDTVARFHVAHSPLASVVGLSDCKDGVSAREVAQSVRRSLIGDGLGPMVCDWAEQLVASCSRRELSRLEQLVELAYGYETGATLRADDFVAYVQNTRVSDPIPADVRVMTVHQAKGLEFDIVVLPELDAGLVGQPDQFVIDRPDVTGPVAKVCRYASADVQQLMPSDIQRMFAEATDREVTESLCVLYVAITRAIHAVHAIIPPSTGNEKSLPRTFAGLLRVALKDERPVEPDAVLYRHGDPQWFRHPGSDKLFDAVSATPDAMAKQEPVRVQLAATSGERRRGWERSRPSGLEGGNLVHLKHVFAAGRSDAFFRGELIHAWFEQIDWLDDGRPDERVLRRVADDVMIRAGSASLDVDEQLARFDAMLDLPSVADVLSRSRYQGTDRLGFPPAVSTQLAGASLSPLALNEHGFAMRDGGQLMTGFIDRLVLLQDGGKTIAAEVLDYKTDTFDAEQLADKLRFYAPQIEAYRRAVARSTNLPPERIAASLVFVDGDVVRQVAWPG